jgi:hypothetical protein
MALYSLAQTGTSTTSANAVTDMAVSTGCRPRLMEAAWFLGAATASTHSLRRSSALGTRTSPIALLGEDPGDPTLTGINLVDSAIAFSAEPTEATTAIRRIGLPATIGVGVVWTFPRGLVLAVSLSFLILNDATNANSLPSYWVADV